MNKENNSLFNDIINKLFNKSTYNDKIRQELEAALNDDSLVAPSDEEMQITMQQFTTYTTLQLLQYIALKDRGSDANAFMSALIDDFTQQKRSHAAIQLEIDAIEQKDTALSKILSEDLMHKERELVGKRLDNLYTEFEKKIKSIILIDDKLLPNID